MIDFKLLNRLSDLPLSCSFYIYGKGETGRAFLDSAQKSKIAFNFKGFLDSYTSGKIETHPVFKFEEIKALLISTDIIVICSMYWHQIISKNKFPKNITVYVITNGLLYEQSNLSCFGGYYFDEIEELLAKHYLEILKPRFLDKKSVQLFTTLIQLHNPLTEKKAMKKLPTFFSNKKQYMEQINFKKVALGIEGGTFDGVNTIEIAEAISPRGRLHTFDPFLDMTKAQKLSDYIKKHKTVISHQKALWWDDRGLNIQTKEISSNNVVSTNGTFKDTKDLTQIATISIDSYMQRKKIKKLNFLKMDIEGGEKEVILGGRRTISKYAPVVAVSIYHKRRDLFEIPSLLLLINPNYRFHIKQYSNSFVDTVLYAVVKN